MKTPVHFADNSLINPTNPVIVNLIGAGGTGSNLLTSLSKINYALITLGHPGLFVQVFDDDRVTPANLGRQLFGEAELGQYKAVALVNRVNHFSVPTGKLYPKGSILATWRACPKRGGRISISPA